MMLDNKWQHGFKGWRFRPPMSRFIHAGVFPLPMPLDSSLDMGIETALIAYDPDTDLTPIGKDKPITFELKTAVVTTSFGPILLLFFSLTGNNGDGIQYEMTINPHNSDLMDAYTQLSNQTHWHLFILDHNGSVIDVNIYGLQKALDIAREAAKGSPCIDFSKAKAEYERDYSCDDV